MGKLKALLAAGTFVVTAEVNPPRSADGAVVRRAAEALRGYVDAANVTDSSRARVAMAAWAAAVLLMDEGVEPIVQMTGRDRNRIALQGDLLGIAALGLPNVVLMTGDNPTQGDHPQAVHVADLDGLGLVRAVVEMRNHRRFLSGGEIGTPPDVLIGATASPFATPPEPELRKTLEKIEAGADFLQTQPVFDHGAFADWIGRVRSGGARAAILAGVLILRSAEQAARLAKVPGMTIPGAVIDRMRASGDPEAEGIAIAAETIRALRTSGAAQGVHLYSVEHPEASARAIGQAGLLPRPEVP